MTTFIEIAVGGLALGATFALVGLGLNIVYATAGVINFAHGEFGMVAVVITLQVNGVLDLPLGVAVVVGLVIAGLIAVAADVIAVRPVTRSGGTGLSAYGWVVTTLGVAIVIQHVTALFFGTASKSFPSLLPSGAVSIWGLSLPNRQLAVLGVVTGIVLMFSVVMKSSQFGRSARAIADNSVISAAFGIRIGIVRAIIVLVSGAVVGVAAILLAPQTFVNPFIGTTLLLNGFVAVVLGGLGNIRGGLLGGCVLGLTYAISGRYAPLVLQTYIPFIFLIGWITFGGLIRDALFKLVRPPLQSHGVAG